MKEEVFEQEIINRVNEIYYLRMALNEKMKHSGEPSDAEVLQMKRIPDFSMSMYFSEAWELMPYEDIRKSITIDGKELTKQGYLDFLSLAASPTSLLYLEYYPEKDKKALSFIFKTEDGQIKVNVDKPTLKDLMQDEKGDWKWV